MNAREAFKRQSIAVAMRSTLVIPSVYEDQRGREDRQNDRINALTNFLDYPRLLCKDG